MYNADTSTGSLFIITAASGTGKTTLVKQLTQTTNDLVASISHTTRPPRSGEIDGQHYHFVSRDDFLAMARNGDFLESATVFEHLYGTSQAAIERLLSNGIDVILEIDWQGALQVKKLIPDAVAIFVLPPNKSALRKRLLGRGQDSSETIEQRLLGARSEMEQYVNFDYLVINDNFDIALAELKAIILAQRLTLAKQQIRQQNRVSELLT